jgi:predicted transcriptional regulator
VRGVKFLYPYPIAFAYPTIERYRLRTGNPKHEITFSAISLIIGVLYLPIVFQGGATATLHNVLATVQSAYEEYQSTTGIEKFLVFEGYDFATKHPVAGRALILDAAPEQFTVFFNGQVLTIGEYRGNIIATAARCISTTTPISTTNLTFTSKPWATIASQIPSDVLISGDLTADHPFAIKGEPQNQRISAIHGQTIRLSYALPQDITRLHIQPRTNLEQLTAELTAMRQSLANTEHALQDTIAIRAQEKGAYRRDQLFAHIQSLRKEQSSITDRIERLNRDIQAAKNVRLFFSGTLSVRPCFVN